MGTQEHDHPLTIDHSHGNVWSSFQNQQCSYCGLSHASPLSPLPMSCSWSTILLLETLPEEASRDPPAQHPKIPIKESIKAKVKLMLNLREPKGLAVELGGNNIHLMSCFHKCPVKTRLIICFLSFRPRLVSKFLNPFPHQKLCATSGAQENHAATNIRPSFFTRRR